MKMDTRYSRMEIRRNKYDYNDRPRLILAPIVDNGPAKWQQNHPASTHLQRLLAATGKDVITVIAYMAA